MTEPHRQLEEFYLEHRQGLLTCALAVTRCADLAEDAIQEVFERMFRRGAIPENLKSYVFRAVRNAGIDALRKRAKSPLPLEDSIFAGRGNPRETAETEEFRGKIEQALPYLSADERETVIQHIYGDLTFREIAEVREVSVSTAASWYRRGIEKLRERLEV